MYYIGTKSECEAYNKEVSNGEGYENASVSVLKSIGDFLLSKPKKKGITSKWAEIIKHNTKSEYAIVANGKYKSNMTTIETLPSDWYDNTDPFV